MYRQMIDEAVEATTRNARKLFFDFDDLNFAIVTGLTARIDMQKDILSLEKIENYLRATLVATQSLAERIKAAKEAESD